MNTTESFDMLLAVMYCKFFYPTVFIRFSPFFEVLSNSKLMKDNEHSGALPRKFAN